ncbi:fungal-specific transcription factor [Podospora conica]|nr:fungal-specific transcription factor [Schizothecium conicum]
METPTEVATSYSTTTPRERTPKMAPRASKKVPSSPGRPSVRKVACRRCRERRTYCTNERPSCSFCRERSEPCVYTKARKVWVNEDYLRSLQEDSRAYHALLATINGNAPPAHPHVPPEEADEESESDDEIFGPFSHHDDEQQLKPGSAKSFAHNVSVLTDVGGNETRTPDQHGILFDLGVIPSRRWFHANVCLPPPQVGHRLFAAQYTYIGTIFAFTDPDTFDRELAAAFVSKPDLWDTDACLAYAKVLIILAFGKMYSVNEWVDYRGPPGIEFFTEALQLLPDAYEEGSILCVETLALVGYFFQNLNQPDAAFLYIGMALRMAISLGLHQEVSQSSNPNHPHYAMDEATREHRRRVWWSIYSLDRILSVKSGNPLTIHDEDIGVKLPSKLPGEAEYCPAVVLRHYTRLSMILGQISKSIYRRSTKRRSARRLMSTVQNIILALSEWETELPHELRFAPEKLAGSRECVSTFSHYYQCINMTARPLLFHVVRKRLKAIATNPDIKETDWRHDLNDPTTVRVIEMCISAAKETIRMMVEAKDRNLLATYGYMDGEHVFSAAIVLVMICAAFPADESNTAAMNVGLDLLDVMAVKGVNSHMAARYDLLTRLRAAFIPGEYPKVRTPLFPSAPARTAGHPLWEPDLSSMTVGLVAAQAASGPGYPASPMSGEAPRHPSLSSMTVGLVAAQAASGPGYPTSPMSGEAPRPRSNSIAFFEGFNLSLLGANTLSPFPVSNQDTSAEAGPQYQTGTSAMELDGMVWEEGFADAHIDAGYEFDHWNSTSG